MALTPTDVHNQQFTTVRMRTGYDMDEVDSFLDVVEAEIGRLLTENDDLRAQLTQAQSRILAAEQRAANAKAPSAPPKPAEETAPSPVEPEVATVAEVSLFDEVVVETAEVGDDVEVVESVTEIETTSMMAPAAAPATGEAPSEQALKILEIAQRTADETVEHARSEAAAILSDARTKAAVVTADLDADRIALETQVSQLRTFERNYRTALRDHIAAQLADFDRAANREESVAGPTPAITAGDSAASEASSD
jgi:DivIVA domain-containing protein